MNSKNHNTTRSAAKHSGKAKQHKRRQNILQIDWAFRRLRNQAVRFFSAGDREIAHDLRTELNETHSYSQIERRLRRLASMSGSRTWTKFMDSFFSHRVNRHVAR
jgi:hypothetical protein